ncbi:MAG: hypothetical protein SAJ37_02280 [Oscillatoria sp. PMC 1068.18]|nr:hypothetical protein [Oscillatoria sp. PMC 1076.18]MEC4987551.1 hypothetical protein [Oscillatoria sp. PMC 1068.18]
MGSIYPVKTGSEKLLFFLLLMSVIFTAIKIVSIGLITGAIGLELYDFGAFMLNFEVINFLKPIILFARIALIAHLIEAIIAWYKKQSIRAGFYTFFVGTVGLLEVFGIGKSNNWQTSVDSD